MATSLKNLSDYDPSKVPDASEFKFGIAVAEWNSEITNALLDGCIEALKEHGVKEENIGIQHVPGSFELPTGAQILFDGFNPHAAICLGCVIKGETSHNEYINQSVANAIQGLGLVYRKPVIFGVLTPNTLEQAQDRAGGKHGNKGVEAAITAIKMVAARKDQSLTGGHKISGFFK